MCVSGWYLIQVGQHYTCLQIGERARLIEGLDWYKLDKPAPNYKIFDGDMDQEGLYVNVALYESISQDP